MYFEISTSRARKTFKRLLGQTNHYLITLLIGLDYVKKNDVTLPEEFKTSWNPRDQNSSSIRSREFAINATFSWAIDALDAYLSLCHKKPSLYQSKDIQDNAGGAGQSAYKKFIVLKDFVSTDNQDDFIKFAALTEVAIKWRNKLVHYFADNTVDNDKGTFLLNNAQFYHDNFQGLNIVELLLRFDNSQTPRFKEITSIIRGIHKFVESSDGFLLRIIDKEIHFIDCLDYHLKLNSENDSELKGKIGLLFNLPNERRTKSLHQTIMNYGFTLSATHKTTIKQEWVDNFSALTNNEALTFLNEINYDNKKTFLDNKM